MIPVLAGLATDLDGSTTSSLPGGFIREKIPLNLYEAAFGDLATKRNFIRLHCVFADSALNEFWPSL